MNSAWSQLKLGEMSWCAFSRARLVNRESTLLELTSRRVGYHSLQSPGERGQQVWSGRGVNPTNAAVERVS
ncbi:TPA: hypothetical protein ACXEYS_004991 [Escherichia coli]